MILYSAAPAELKRFTVEYIEEYEMWAVCEMGEPLGYCPLKAAALFLCQGAQIKYNLAAFGDIIFLSTVRHIMNGRLN